MKSYLVTKNLVPVDPASVIKNFIFKFWWTFVEEMLSKAGKAYTHVIFVTSRFCIGVVKDYCYESIFFRIVRQNRGNFRFFQGPLKIGISPLNLVRQREYTKRGSPVRGRSFNSGRSYDIFVVISNYLSYSIFCMIKSLFQIKSLCRLFQS